MPRWGVLSLSILLLPLFAQAQGPRESKHGPPPALVVTAPVTAEMVRAPLILVGTAEPRYQAAVATEGAGRVEALPARRGEQVAQGAPLARLRTLPLELRLQEGRARQAEVEARIAKAQADARRGESLFAQKFISEEELQTLTTELAALRRQREQVAAELRLLQDQLKRLEVRAPFAGRVVEENTEIGEWLGEGDPVVLLADLSVVHVVVPVPERQIGEIAPGLKVEVVFDALPGRTFPGEVAAIVPQADQATRTFPVEISIPNPEGRILAGMLARITFHLGEPRPALLVPKDALVPQPGGGGHLVKVDAGRAVIVPVRVTGTYGQHYAVESSGPPLAPGDRVVVRGNERLRPGQTVKEQVPGQVRRQEKAAPSAKHEE